MCEQARKTSIRRKHIGGAGVLLGTLVSETISATGGVPESATWDSWRREDGRWTVLVTPDGAAHPATFLFDVKSRYVVPADEFAHDLVGDVALPDSADMAIADAVRAPDRPVGPSAGTSVLPEILDDIEIEIEIEVAQVHTEVHEDPRTGVSSLKAARDRKALEQLVIGETDEPDDAETVAALEREVDDFEDSLEHDVAVPDTLGPRKKRHERRRVPSWDEIMFGDKGD